MSDDTAQLKQKRQYALGKFTRVRRRALHIVNGKGSMTELLRLRPEIEKAYFNLGMINDQYIDKLEDSEDVARAQSYLTDAEMQYQEAMTQIERYLQERKDEPDSVVNNSQGSETSYLSLASKKAEIT